MSSWTKKSNWGVRTSPENFSFQDVMSEQVARDLQQQETNDFTQQLDLDTQQLDLNQLLDEQCEPDFILAKLLQLQFDKEFEHFTKQQKEEQELSEAAILQNLTESEVVSEASIDDNSLQAKNEASSLLDGNDNEATADNKQSISSSLPAVAVDKSAEAAEHASEKKISLAQDIPQTSANGRSRQHRQNQARTAATANADDEYNSDDDDEDDFLDDEESDREWDMFEKAEKYAPLGRVGYVAESNGRIRTKHDLNQAGRMNACRAMNMNLSTGDGGGFEMKLNNNVFNSLKTYVAKEKRRAARLNEKIVKSTTESVMDEKSKLLIFKLLQQGTLDEFNGIISTGKESNVYHGTGCNIDKKINLTEVAIKIFKTTLTEFKNRSTYIRGDFRFKDRLSKTNSDQIFRLWAQKESFNLYRLKRANIPCPDVVQLKKHILVMTFLGKNGSPSPTLREASHLSDEQWAQVMNETIEIIKRMWNKCHLVHADLSEYNLIYHMGHVWVIDVGQSVLSDHPEAFNFLLRDCRNISRFFLSRGIVDMLSGQRLFEEITGHEFDDGRDKNSFIRLVPSANNNKDNINTTIGTLPEQALQLQAKTEQGTK